MSDLLHEVIDQLVETHGPHWVMAALIDNEKMQKEILDSPNVAWSFQYKWRDGRVNYCQNWSVLILPSITIYGENDRQRPIG